VIGHAPGKSIIISAPSIANKYPILRENQHFVVRMLQGNRVYGFESEVLKYYTSPCPHVHLRQPRDIESITVRGSRRVDTALVVSVQTGEAEPINATMLNTSATGALIQCKQPLGDLQDTLKISLELAISSVQKYLCFTALIRNLTLPEEQPDADSRFYRYGVQFVDLDNEQSFVINAYVHEQLVLQMEE
jgi:c-di-GMP-binding flagellar brake protein YcgR